jgi:beta-galactosidase
MIRKLNWVPTLWGSSILFLVILLLSACAAPADLGAVRTDEIDLKGTWRLALDRNDIGVEEQWFKRKFSDPIQLPGTLRDNGYGDEITATTEWMSRLHDKYWYLRADYKKYAQPGNVKIPFWLQPERKYTGVAWYQRDITIPESWRGRRTVVSLERAHWSTTLWLNDRRIGYNDCLAAPHVYDLGILEPGRYTLSVRVDNRMLVNIREDAHAITDSTQSNWHGLVGRLMLESTSPVWIEDIRVFTDIKRKAVRLKVNIGNAASRPGRGKLTAGKTSVPVRWTADGASAEMEVLLGDKAELWDEFNPALHRLTLKLQGEQAEDQRELVFGLREIKSRNAAFYLNGRKTFFRGTHEGCSFPLTGYPPTDVQSWKKIFRVVKDYGLNHVRFHSWCPPEAAFTAADELGVYLQPECSNWGQYSSRDNTMLEFLHRESERLVKAYGNHPSFVMLSSGNEPAGPWQEPLLKWCADWRQRDNRRIYTGETGWSFGNRPGPVQHVDYLIAIRFGFYRFRGDRGWFGRDFRKSLQGTNCPIISHETGQWCAYPNFDDMDKYTGSLKPKNYEIFRDSLAEHGMLDQAHDFMMASGKLQVACYKEEIEALLRTPGMDGFQLLDLHDYPGQGTALVGVLNVFWQSKGYITPRQFRRFCNVTVPLARMKKWIYTTADDLNVDVEIAHFGKTPLVDALPVWKIVDRQGKVVTSGQFSARTVPIGNGIQLGTVSTKLSAFEAPQQYKLVVGLKDTTIENDWDFWVYPAQVPTKAPSDILVTRSFDEAAERLAAGGKVLFMPAYKELGWESPPIGRLPIFWNCLMVPHWERSLGLLCDPDHPALADFPTDYYYNWQWQDIIRPYCRAMNMDSLPRALRPIIQPIDDWNRNYKLGMVFECRLGSGKLMVCSADLEIGLGKRLVARQLRHSLLRYMSSDRFNPTVDVSPEQIRGLLFDNRLMKKLGAVAKADEQAPHNEAARAIDGNPSTYWLTARRDHGRKHPHELIISFPAPVSMTGVLCMPRQNSREHEGDIRDYVIEVSDDGEQWKEAARGRLESTFAPQKIQFGQTVTVRYLKLRALSGFGGDTSSSLAELAVLYAGPDY